MDKYFLSLCCAGRQYCYKSTCKPMKRFESCHYNMFFSNLLSQARVSVPPLKHRLTFDYHTLLLFYKLGSEVTPTYLSSFSHLLLSSYGYTGKLKKMSYPVPKESKKFTLSSSLNRPIMLWNDLPSELQKTSSPLFSKIRYAIV